ncbi:hypothetical protein KR222_005512, partial [Zaprionus bogoriensis]
YLAEPTWNIHSTQELKKRDFWFHDAQRTLYEKLYRQPNQYVAKNVIFFLGDGMSVPTVTASRIYDGQLRGIVGERNRLEFEKFEFVGLSKTYCVDKQVSDSACTASAYLSGVKANYQTIGVSADVKLNDCAAEKLPQNRLSSIAEWALDRGKAAGLVTTARVTHASPAGVYAHTSNRDFESDYDVEDLGYDPSSCPDIAQQLLDKVGQGLKVVMGGGTRKFLPNTLTDVYGNRGERLDGRNLLEEWQQSKPGNAHVIFNRSELLAIDPRQTDFLLGLFNTTHLAYHLDDSIDTPTLAEMTETAIRVLSADPAGFFLFVEGGRIDHAHHQTKAKKALDETVQFSDAVRKALQLTNPWETLIVVSADHGHTMTISGYPDIDNSIDGLNSELSDEDNLPYATLSYANGRHYERFYTAAANGTVERVDLRTLNIGHKDARYPHGVPMSEETHGGGDVAVYAHGPWAHLFTGVYEQNTLPHLMGFASCIGPGITYCDLRPKNPYTS